MGELHQIESPSTQIAHSHHPGFDFQPLSAPPVIDSAGRISGKGV